MKILMVSSEAVPFAKTGGLADAVSALAIILNKFLNIILCCIIIFEFYVYFTP